MGHPDDGDLETSYSLAGALLKARVVELLGPDWTWEGRRVLDFGCGSGRLLRHWLDEARVAEFHGADVSEELVSWVRANLCPPIAGVEVSGDRPPLDFPDGHFDLITALSVFTHIADGWSQWLLELHRVLRTGGILVATFLDSSGAESLAPLPLDEERIGMAAFGFADPDFSWPNVIHSHWWLREHWGRAFEVTHLTPGESTVEGEGGPSGATQGWMALRARDVDLTPEDLERENPDDERYLKARRCQLELLQAEGERLRARFRPRWPFGRGYRGALKSVLRS